MLRLFVLVLLFVSGIASAQQLIFPDSVNWNQLREGKSFSFRVKVREEKLPKFSLEGINGYGIQFDTLGNFSWTPSFDLVDRLEKQKEINLIFQAEWKDGRKARMPINFTVLHQNRPPEIADLPVFYVKQGVANKYQVSSDYVHDPDGDPLVFRISQAQLPEGMAFSSLGLLTWTPSRNQFNNLKKSPLLLEFVAQDQPDKAETAGKIKVVQTQLDLPPEILLVPGDSLFSIKENERLSFKIYVSDPNGDDDIRITDFLSSDDRIAKSCLKENTPAQYEFTWSPGYAFTDDAEKTREVELIFFAVDKSSNRAQHKVKVKVIETENLELKDKFLYEKYKVTLSMSKTLLDQLNIKHKYLEKEYVRAKKGKKKRSIGTASIGLGSVVASTQMTNPNDLKSVSYIGGGVTAALSSLEAGQVIGKNANDILELIKTETEIRNKLQSEGDIFARKYALKSTRRTPDFDNDRDKFLPILNHEKLAQLELDASKPLNTKYDAKEIRKTFADFSEE